MSVGWIRTLLAVSALGTLVSCSEPPSAGDGAVTFNRDIAPIVFEHCAPCHRPGEAAPFDLLTFEATKKRARQMAEVTADRYMPPWLPEPGPVAFVGEDVRRISDRQIELIGRWAAQGAPEGDPADLPETPEFPDGWQLGEPDLIVRMDRPYRLEAGAEDVFRHFVLPTELDELRYVRGIELRPGNKRVAHHAVVMVDRTWASFQKDALDPLPGFDGMVPTREARIPDGHLVGWLPGSLPRFAEPGMAWRLHPGADIVIQLHMLPSGKPETIQPTVGLFFTDTPPTRDPFVIRMGSKAIDIPAGVDDYEVRDSYTLPVDVEVLGVYPHAHYLGKQMKGSATRPDGSSVELIEIKDWDFNWQDQYRYVEPVFLPKGSVLEMRYTYDNSASNPRNPNFPPIRVSYGPRSSDEMADLSFQLLPRNRRDWAILAQDFARKDLSAMMAGSEKMIELHPQDAQNYGELAVGYVQLGRYGEAMAQLQQALRIDPEYAHAHYYVGTLWAMQNQNDRAIEHIERALALDPQLVDAMTNLAALYWQRGRLGESEELYRRAIRRRPDLVDARLALGRMLAERGDRAEAITHLETVVQQQPEDALTRYRLSLLLSQESRTDEALQHARLAYESALQSGGEALAREIRLRLSAQEQGRPFHAAPGSR